MCDGGVRGREAVVVAEEESEGDMVVGVHVGYDAGGEGGVLFCGGLGLGGWVGGHAGRWELRYLMMMGMGEVAVVRLVRAGFVSQDFKVTFTLVNLELLNEQ